MAGIKPFCALRPEKNMADKIAALPYDVQITLKRNASSATAELLFHF